MSSVTLKVVAAIFLTAVLAIQICSLGNALDQAQVQTVSRYINVSLVPNYQNGSLWINGNTEYRPEAGFPDLTGLPLNIEYQGNDAKNSVWIFTGTANNVLTFDLKQGIYHLSIGPIILQPNEVLNLSLPFVDLDFSKIQPPPDSPTPNIATSQQPIHYFTYTAGADGRQISSVDIPFQSIAKKIDLTLTPLIGEAIVGNSDGLRISGKIQFNLPGGYAAFGEYCRITAERLQSGDYRMAHLLNNLDFPHYSGLSGFNRVYQVKPSVVGLRSELITCQYDQEKKINLVEAVFSGRVVGFHSGEDFFPLELQNSDFPDGNYSYDPTSMDDGVSGFEVRLGKVVLEPGDILTVTIPNVQIQFDGLNPAPDSLVFPTHSQADQKTYLVYRGPSSFELAIPYIPKMQLYVSQFPSVLRPGISLVETQLGNFFPISNGWLTWLVLGFGLLLLIISRFVLHRVGLNLSGWLLIYIGLYFGMPGSYGLLCMATLLCISKELNVRSELNDRKTIIRNMAIGLASFILIFVAVFFENQGTFLFSGLSEQDLSPLTPVILLIVVAGLLWLFYGKQITTGQLHDNNLPVFVSMIATLALFDSFNRSLLSLLVLFAGGLYVCRNRIGLDNGNRKNSNHRNTFGKELQRRFRLAFGNTIVPVSIFFLIVFAIGNDLSSTFANEMQVSLAALVAPLVIPLLDFVSVLLTFTSIACLFVLVYPFLPSQAGYVKAAAFAFFLFVVFLFGIGTDNRLIALLPNILVGRIIYYFSVPMLIGIYFDIYEFMQKENKRRSSASKTEQTITFQVAGSMYLKNLQSLVGTLAGILSLVAPSVYAFVSSQPVFVTYFSLLEKLVLLPI